MKRKCYLSVCAVLYVICAASGVLFISTDFLNNPINHLSKLITAVLILSCGFAASYLSCKPLTRENARKRRMSLSLKLLFIAYTLIVLDFTLLDGSFGRDISSIFSVDDGRMSEYIGDNTNIVPFATITLFFRGYIGGSLTLGALVENILGNFFVFMPFALLFPVAFPRIDRWYRFLFVMLIMIIVIELLQLLLLTGSSDIDDLILNASGAMLVYGVLQTEPVAGFFEKITFGVFRKTDRGGE